MQSAPLSTPQGGRHRTLTLKRWLIEEDKDDLAILSRASSAYASMLMTSLIGKEMRSLRANGEGATPACAVRELMDDENNLFLLSLDQGFVYGKGFISAPKFDESDAAWNERIDSVCHYVNLCLRLSVDNEKSLKTLACRIYDQDMIKSGAKLRRDLQPLLTIRRSRLSFVYVARYCDRWLFDHPEAAASLLGLLRNQAEDIPRLQKFFSRVAYVQSILARGSDISCKDIEDWNGTKALRPKSIERVPMEEQTSARGRRAIK